MSNLVGIDLGTTYSAIARLDDTGRPEIIVNKEGENITPSIVLLESKTDVIVGSIAKSNYGAEPNIFGRFKREMGTNKEYKAHGEIFNPTSLSSFVLNKLKEDAESIIGDINEAVVTIPANFANEAREATLSAAKTAGLSIKDIINEPTAAALYYAYSSGEELSGIYAVYDLGGGTFDISIIKVEGTDIEVMTTDGVNKLGGDDFDDKIIEIVRTKFKKETGKDLEVEDFTKNDAEEIKKTLSARNKAKTSFSSSGERAIIEVSRKEFVDAISTKIAEAEMTCENAIDAAELSVSDINQVILVGGSTRMPCVQESVEKVFKKKPKTVGNPDEAVALGAALFVAYKADPAKLNPLQKKAVAKVKISDVTSKFFGFTSSTIDEETSKRIPINSIIIPKDEKIPCTITKDFYTIADGQTLINLTVNETHVEETDPEFAKAIWEGTLEVPEGRPAGQRVDVTFAYDENQIMKCSFLDVSSNIKTEIDLNVNNEGSKSEIDINDFKVE